MKLRDMVRTGLLFFLTFGPGTLMADPPGLAGDFATADQALTMNLSSRGLLARVKVTGTWTGEVVLEGTTDAGLTWDRLTVQDDNAAIYREMVVNGLYAAPIGAFTSIRARAQAVFSGTASVFLSTGNGQLFTRLPNTAAVLATPTSTLTITKTATPTFTPTTSPTPSFTPTITRTATPTITLTPTFTPTETPTPTDTPII